MMKRDNPARHFILAFAIALIGYVIVYHFIENRRTRKGAWQVTFTNTSAGNPEIVINQTVLNISDIRIQFPSVVSNQSPMTLKFNQPKPVPYDVPFGRCVFMDTTFLPGTLTFQFFHHEIELLPRVLVIDQKEHAWKSGDVFTINALPGTNSPPHPLAR